MRHIATATISSTVWMLLKRRIEFIKMPLRMNVYVFIDLCVCEREGPAWFRFYYGNDCDLLHLSWWKHCEYAIIGPSLKCLSISFQELNIYCNTFLFNEIGLMCRRSIKAPLLPPSKMEISKLISISVSFEWLNFNRRNCCRLKDNFSWFSGYKMSRPLCRNRMTSQEVEESLCNAIMRPEPAVVQCNTHSCPPK